MNESEEGKNYLEIYEFMVYLVREQDAQDVYISKYKSLG